MPPRVAKRTKLSEPKSPANVGIVPPEDKHAAFTAWSKERGVEIRHVKPAQLPGRGLGLVTTAKIKTGARIIFVPEKAMFKPYSFLTNASPQAQLAVSLLVDCIAAQPTISTWAATWPTDVDFEHSMPLRWPESLRDLIPPPVEQPLRRQEEDLLKDLNSVHDFLAASELSDDDFRYYWFIVNSRSFHWKPSGGKVGSMVMCPFIDYINHAPSGSACNVFERANGYEVVADRDYGEFWSQFQMNSLPFRYFFLFQRRIVLSPYCQIKMRSIALKVLRVYKRKIVTNPSEAAGEEILATYGAHSNDKLLVHYGFVCHSGRAPNHETPNRDDDIRLDHILLPALTPAVRTQLQDVGFLGGYALLPASNELCFKTQVAVRAMLLTCNEWEYFVANGEDLGEDQSGAVRTFVAPLLKQYSDEAAEKLVRIASKREDLRDRNNEFDLLDTRWTQIAHALEDFLDSVP
ncbi:hypothetical protein LTS16_006628 [Friedmanniomyces endolithicus]|uniref:Uncharacterized protein n=1 Tax=Friedmanniomyces endolithicus TaxID=329885 RepID=A0A4U0V1S5_9PEZI|nr:hypothetical protein LTS09_008343 [Friedmanniomyces endolithicus]KAK0989123.1 hypothetical protein LTS01_009017 [Friedmanniomyces endolithicus]KAK1045384.1 hypothetical protein LTS16_006628 [Friedmanniomyces endolithicus]TKA42323.1 hypothetical protein B0A54_06772 [Friedmanniomyces endolithicus]